METPRDDQLAADLRALRPTPRPEFSAELDERAAAGFPRRSRLSRYSLGSLRFPKARRLALASGVAILAIAVAGAVLTNSGSDSSLSGGSLLNYSGGDLGAAPEPIEKSTPEAGASAAVEATESSRGFDNRAVERGARIVLGADPDDLAENAAEVLEVVHAYDGVVLRSTSHQGPVGEAGAHFELRVPSAKLGDALAALSEIGELRSRYDTSLDITAPTVAVGELLQDSKARIDSLLGQLEGAETESEREAVEAELRQERRHRARLRADLQRLQRHAQLSRVTVRIDTDAPEDSSGGAWGIGGALDDAGQILAIAAAVAFVALAILGPIALIALLAWLAHRAWLRRERRRVLS